MYVLEQMEAYLEKDGELVFSHVKSIIKLDADLFYTCTEKKLRPDAEDTARKLNLVPIPVTRIFPKFNLSFTLAVQPFAPDCYIKRPSLIHYEDITDCDAIHETILHEATVCEFLNTIPHPNIVQYRGCVVENGMITGLCLKKYEQTLAERAQQRSLPFDAEACFQRIEEAVRHLHQHGLVRNDIKPSNVMIDIDGTPILIDFDSCQRVGASLGCKGGTMEWSDADVTMSQFENDLCGLSKLKYFILEATN